MSVFFPLGISNFAELSQENFVYIDKTHFIELLEHSKQKRIVYLRPRRFGKSLFISLLEHYYDLHRKEQFQELFGKFYIGRKPTPLANQFRILFFNFSAIDTTTQANSFSGFLDKIKLHIRTFNRRYALFKQEELTEILAQSSPEKVMNTFFALYPENSNKIYLLIDEYDHFTNEVLVRNLQEFIEIVSANGYVRKFYEAIKNATQQGIVDRFFITGVSPITLDSLTSGFNIVTHLTHHKDFEAMIGFTETEVKSLLKMVLKDKKRQSKIMQDLRNYYNGYKFYAMSQENIYNSDMILYFLDYFKREQQYPLQILDPNIMPDYGKLKKLFEVANWHANIKVLQEILENGSIASEQIYQFSFDKGFGKKEFVNFLFYLGNLTIKKTDVSGMVIFRIPNKMIAELYWQYYAQVLQETANLPFEEDNVAPAVREMALSGKTDSFFSLIQKLLQSLSNRDFVRFDEKHIKMSIMAYLMQANIFDVRSERELDGGSYIDLELYIKPNNPFKHHQFAIELKYLKKEQKNLLEQTQQEAQKQILTYYYQDSVLQSKEMLHLLSVVIVKDEIFVQEVKI
ncbi:AAA family ATPase [Raineya sp.]|jgi:hypothetical protein